MEMATVENVTIMPDRASFAHTCGMIEELGSGSDPGDILHEIFNGALGLGDLGQKLLRIEAERLPAGGACHLSVSLQPTDLLLRLLAAAGAGNG